jgi:hypothetical protein
MAESPARGSSGCSRNSKCTKPEVEAVISMATVGIFRAIAVVDL